jgi:hypothetical protein
MEKMVSCPFSDNERETLRIAIMAHTSPIIAATLLGLALSSSTLALNMDFLRLDPLRFYTQEDFRISEQTAIEALDNNADNVSSEWENPESGNSGVITPLSTFNNKKGETCRTVKIVDRTEALSGEDTVHVCKEADSGWRIIGHARSKVE